jgi:soluble lytic murein transglycosylase-like protein
MKPFFKTLMFTLFFLFFYVLNLKADIYKYIDSNGVLYFTNVPIASGYQLYIKETPKKIITWFPTKRYDTYISEASERYDIDFPLLKALIKVESNFNPRAVSHKGAKGLMQIMPGNYTMLNIRDPFNPKENIMGGARYLKLLIKKFQGRLPLALAAYNAGPTAVERYRRIPPYKETQIYVKKVMKYYNVLKDGQRGL